MPATRTKPKATAPTQTDRAINPIHRVQGISSSLDHLTLNGESYRAAVGQEVAEATLERKIIGASVLRVVVFDPHRQLLTSLLLQEAHEVEVDGLRWRLVKVSNAGWNQPLELFYEPLIVYLLKKVLGPHKAFRDKVTRAEYCKLRFLEVANPRAAQKQGAKIDRALLRSILAAGPLGARFISPELHKVQPIATAKDSKEAREEAESTRNKGIGVDTKGLTVKGEKASAAALEMGEIALRIAQSLDAPFRVCVALMEALIVETLIGTYGPGRSNILEGIGPGGAEVTNAEQEIKNFLTGSGGYGTGAITYNKQHPDIQPYELAQAIQNSGAGASTNGRANYGAVQEEARKWVEAFGNGAALGDVMTVRYAFRQAEKESNWHTMVRLAAEVDWRCFESAGWVYFLNDQDLLDSHRRLLVSPSSPGIIDTSFDYDIGKPINEVTVEAQARSWGAPPGSVASVKDHGPADGDYLVSKIESRLTSRTDTVQITLVRGREPLPEPAPKTKRISSSSGGSDLAPGDAPRQLGEVLAEMKDLEGTPYKYGGGHGSGFVSDPASLDCSSAVSYALHGGGLIGQVLASGGLEGYGEAGPGEWITIYARADHAWMEVRTTEGWKAWGTSVGDSGSGGLGWHPDADAAYKATFVKRHPKGL